MRSFSSNDVNETRKQENVMSSNMSINRTVCQGTSQQNSAESGLSRVRMLGMHTPDGDKREAYVLAPIPSYQNFTPPISIPIMRRGQVSSSQPLAHNPKYLPLRDLRNDFESCLSTSTKQSKGKGILLNEITDSNSFDMRYGNLSFSNATPQDHSNCSESITGIQSQDILPDLNCDPDVYVADFESCLSTSTKQKKGKGILVNHTTDPSVYNMQHENLREKFDTPQHHSSCRRIQSQDQLPDLNFAPDDERQEDEDDCEEDDVNCEDICSEDYWDIGDSTYECENCGAYFWNEESINKRYKKQRPEFSLCCGRGKIKLPNPTEPPQILKQMLFGSGNKSNHFREHIRSYNSMFSFTSMGGKVDVSVNQT
ncbi:uncharacterized protein LOC132635051 [Lycium barbarum]|uniref:uncharacterized protein LOC132635051 n=1 Tax=Lycium barbarum TaxID=112863 RepID=UPI00293E8456|nr:uncharacterized protein LOC132635051 [Lycium barbarum]